MRKMLITLEFFSKYLNSHQGVKHPYIFLTRSKVSKIGCVANKKILLDPAAIKESLSQKNLIP